MKTFLDNIITYLDSSFNAESVLAKKPKGHYAYENGLTPDADTPFYTVQLLDFSTDKEIFSQEATTYAPIQINVYGVKMRINSVLYEAQETALLLANYCKSYMETYKYQGSNHITSMRLTSCTPALPYDDGSKAYYSALRYSITFSKTY